MSNFKTKYVKLIYVGNSNLKLSVGGMLAVRVFVVSGIVQ